jgi:hypothetical protein
MIYDCHLRIKSAHSICLKTAMTGSPIYDNDNWTMEPKCPLSLWRERVRSPTRHSRSGDGAVRVDLPQTPPHLHPLPLGRGD